MKTLRSLLFVISGGCFLIANLAAQSSASQPTSAPVTVPTKPLTPMVPMPAVAPKVVPPASVTALPTDLQALIKQFETQRDTLLAQRQATIDQLKNATADQRAKILAQLQADMKAHQAELGALAKQIRQDMMDLRNTQKNKKPGG